MMFDERGRPSPFDEFLSHDLRAMVKRLDIHPFTQRSRDPFEPADQDAVDTIYFNDRNHQIHILTYSDTRQALYELFIDDDSRSTIKLHWYDNASEDGVSAGFNCPSIAFAEERNEFIWVEMQTRTELNKRGQGLGTISVAIRHLFLQELASRMGKPVFSFVDDYSPTRWTTATYNELGYNRENGGCLFPFKGPRMYRWYEPK